MRPIRHWSIKTKLIMLSVVSVGVALALSCVGITVNEIHTMHGFKRETLQAQAEMLAFNCTGVLSFSDASAAEQLLASLQSQPTVKFACLYSNNGKVLATYPAKLGSESAPPVLEGNSCQFTDQGNVEVIRQVIDGGEHVGTLYLRASADDLSRQLKAYAKIVAVVILVALTVSILLAGQLQRTISVPILELAQTATKITSLGDYTIRVERRSEDELGMLCTAFNRMLDHVNLSENALRKAHDELEDRVLERTIELRESECRLRIMIDKMPAGILLIDADTHTIVDGNPVACKMIGATKERIIGHTCHKFVCPAKEGRCPISNLGQNVDNADRLLLKANGEQLPVLKTVVPLEIDERHLFLEVFVDISEQKRAEREILRAKEAAEAANVAKSQFLANMSHEIRTPLNAIIGFTDILRKVGSHADEAAREDYLATIHTSGRHLLNLINDVLDLSKIEADKLQIEQIRCSPHEILCDVVSVLRVRALEKGLSLDCRWLSGVPETILTDPARFRQLLMNLVSNAVKFTKTGGVQVIAKLVPDQPDSRLVIQVTDTGIGIPTDKFEAIFDPFIQADNSVTRHFGGTGLGLTISRRIARALGGDIEVSSEVGKGTTFLVSISTGPLKDIEILEAPTTDGMRSIRPQEQEPLPSLAGVDVLLVEDGESNRKLISLVLREAGAKVMTAENGQIGVDLALTTPANLVLMDMQMPVMDGYTATTLLRQKGVRTPIIALTAHAMTGDEEKCRAAGCSGYVTKPIDGDLLVRTIATTLGITIDKSSQDTARIPASASQASPAASGPTSSASLRLEPTDAPLFSTLATQNPDYYEIVAGFIPRLQEQLVAMQEALHARNLPELGRLAHWLKGAAGTVGFPAFTQPAKRLAALVKNQQYDEIEITVAEILELGQRVALRTETPVPTCE